MTEDLRSQVDRFLLDGLDHPVQLLVVTKRHEEVEKLIMELADLREQLKRSNEEFYRMSVYADLYIRALDDLRECERLLRDLGVKVDIRSLRSPLK